MMLLSKDSNDSTSGKHFQVLSLLSGTDWKKNTRTGVQLFERLTSVGNEGGGAIKDTTPETPLRTSRGSIWYRGV